MSNKINRTNKTDGKSQAGIQSLYTGIDGLRQMIEYLLTAVLLILCVVVPFYAKDGYHQIGNAKFEAYRRIMIGGFSVLLVMAVIYYTCKMIAWKSGSRQNAVQLKSQRSIINVRSPITKSRKGKRGLRLSHTDWFVLAYLTLTGVSVVSGGFYDDALWGTFGWNMGFMSQLSFVLLYLFVSRFGKYYRLVLVALCQTAVLVFGIGILHRLLIDPIGFYEGLSNAQKAQFLSTLGQATWYAAFLAVTLPVGVGVFLYAESVKWRIFGGIYMLVGFCTLVTQNSDSAYFSQAGMLLVFIVVSCEKKETLCRFLAMLTLFFAAGKLMYLLIKLRPNPALQPDFVTELMWTSRVIWVLLVVCLAGTVLLYKDKWKKGVSWKCCGVEGESWIDRSSLVRRSVVGIVIGFLLATTLVMILQDRGMLPVGLSEKLSGISYLNWSDDWGNGRGRIWKFTCKVIAEESWCHRIFGVGPDCFNSYVMAYHGEEATLLWGEKLLTNAHNEWLNMLVNGGILGAASYLGIFVTAICRFLRYRRNDMFLVGTAAAVVSYMCYDFFCYQQVLCTPFVFLMMGVGEYIVRKQEQIR